MDHEKIEKERYENMWKNVKKFSEDKADYRSNYPEKSVVGFVKGLKGKVLDLGCGNGRNSVYLAKKGFVVYGIDVSKAAVELAEKNAKENNVKVEFNVGSVFSLPYPNNEFDLIIDCGLLHHLRKPQWKKYLQSLVRVLKSGGHIILHCFSADSEHIKGFHDKRNWSIRGKAYNHFFPEKEIKLLFGKEFSIIKMYETKKGKLRFKEVLMKKN